MASNVVTYLNTMPEHRKRECARLTGNAARHFYEDPQNIAEFEAWLVEYQKTHPEEESGKIAWSNRRGGLPMGNRKDSTDSKAFTKSCKAVRLHD